MNLAFASVELMEEYMYVYTAAWASDTTPIVYSKTIVLVEAASRCGAQ